MMHSTLSYWELVGNKGISSIGTIYGSSPEDQATGPDLTMARCKQGSSQVTCSLSNYCRHAGPLTLWGDGADSAGLRLAYRVLKIES